jgi:hypothetical protein
MACRRFRGALHSPALALQRWLLQAAGRRLASVAQPPAAEAEVMEYPGGVVPFTSALGFRGGTLGPETTIPCYRTLDGVGQALPEAQVPRPLPQALATRMYESMARLQTMDTLFYEAQRQGRFSFYMTSTGEECTVMGAAAALDPRDMVRARRGASAAARPGLQPLPTGPTGRHGRRCRHSLAPAPPPPTPPPP